MVEKTEVNISLSDYLWTHICVIGTDYQAQYEVRITDLAVIY